MFNWFFNLVTKFFKLIVMVMIIGGLFYVGACAVANWPREQQGEYNVPAESQAKHEIIIRNTSNIFYTDSYEQEGSVIVLHGYWEFVDNEYQYRDRDISLDKAVFGEIIIRRR